MLLVYKNPPIYPVNKTTQILFKYLLIIHLSYKAVTHITLMPRTITPTLNLRFPRFDLPQLVSPSIRLRRCLCLPLCRTAETTRVVILANHQRNCRVIQSWDRVANLVPLRPLRTQAALGQQREQILSVLRRNDGIEIRIRTGVKWVEEHQQNL